MSDIITVTKPVNHYVASMVEAIENGEVNPLELYANLKKASKIIDSVLDTETVKEAITREYQKFGKKEVDYRGVTFVQSESGVKFDYSGCNDTVINELEAEKKELDAKIKERQKFLKNLPVDGIVNVDENTGDINTLYPPSRSSVTIIKANVK